jgi:3' terminal RNA ribose 2'-O-methyltransferase Hen1
MLLTISTTHQPATDLGFLLHKNPASAQSRELSFGIGHVLYPEARAERCTAALVLDVDPVGLIRGPSAASSGVEEYVNDRPYVASSFMSVAIARLFGTAMNGTSKERPELAAAAIPLEVRLEVVPCSGGEQLARQLFEPLGYVVDVESHVLDERFPEWGLSRHLSIGLAATCRLADLLSHVYVLLPVMDNKKHYWVERAEIEKLLRRGEGWLSSHPAKDLIVSRYLRHQRSLTRVALERLVEEEGEPDDTTADAVEEQVEQPLRQNDARLQAVLAALTASGATRVADLGCGEGRLLKLLLAQRQFAEIVGMDVSSRALEVAERRLRLEQLPEMQLRRIRLIQGSLVYRDPRLAGFEAACAVEVIEHLDPWRLEAFERAVFAAARPGTMVVTTPNADFNDQWESLPAGEFRHPDHRFEWSREEFAAWSDRVAHEHGYAVELSPVGPVVEGVGAPTQMAVFTR